MMEMNPFNTKDDSHGKRPGKRLPLATQLLKKQSQKPVDKKPSFKPNRLLNKPTSKNLENQQSPKQKQLSLAKRMLNKQSHQLQGNAGKLQQPSPKIRNSSNCQEVRFFTPKEILELAPQQDKAIMELILNRLPLNYTIPDRKFVQIFESLIDPSLTQ
ncbi:hypothetical protein [Mesobacillus maritimus]|uniref:hypothetical protein n=1 Tax=Mesobacillus maritimus TaxID=1643336 RepID=UPI00384C38CF